MSEETKKQESPKPSPEIMAVIGKPRTLKENGREVVAESVVGQLMFPRGIGKQWALRVIYKETDNAHWYPANKYLEDTQEKV